MKSEQELREALLKQELAKIIKHNPNAVPLYIIVNSLNSSECVEQPLTLCQKQLAVKDFLENIRKKYNQFPFVYFFGKERETIEVKGKKGKATSQAREGKERFIVIDEKLQNKVMEQIHLRYKDANGLLVIVVSQTQLVKSKAKPIFETFLYVLAVAFAALFIFLTFFAEEQGDRPQSELDFMG